MSAVWLWVALAVLAIWFMAGRPGWPRRGGDRRHAEGLVTAPLSTGDGDDTLPLGVAATDPAAAPTAEAGGHDLADEEAALRAAYAAAEQHATDRDAVRAAAAQAARQRADAERRQVELAAQREAAEAAARAAATARVEVERRRAAEEAEARRAALAAAAEAAQALRRETERRAAEAERAQVEREAAEREAIARETAMREAAAAQAAAAAASAAALRTPEQILVMVADDSKVVRVKTSRLLARQGFRVVLAEDGEDALRQIDAETPQLLITDVEMPGMDGFELTRQVRSRAALAQLPIIMITSADDRLRDAAAEAGVTVLMGKPYADDALLAQIAQHARVTLPAA